MEAWSRATRRCVSRRGSKSKAELRNEPFTSCCPLFRASALPDCRLHHRGDVFRDFEGDPFVSGGGLEFLFGYAFEGDDGSGSDTADWALSRTDEKAAFEKFIDFVQARLTRIPTYASIISRRMSRLAPKRLMGRYATREN